LTLLREWTRAVEKFFTLASRQPPEIASHPLTCQAYKTAQVRLDRSRLTRVSKVLQEFCVALGKMETSHLPALRAVETEDEAVVLEWTFGDRRLGFSFESNPEESGWYFVMSSGSSERYEAGSLDQLEMTRLVRMTLAAA
jgi:hypothetical protein